MNQDLETLIKQNRKEDAIEYIDSHYASNNTDMQILKIKLLFEVDRKKEALILAGSEEFLSNSKIQYERVLLLKACGRFKLAINVCDRFKDDEDFVLQKIILLFKMGDVEAAYRIANRDEYLENTKIQNERKELSFLVNARIKKFDLEPDNMDVQLEKAKYLRRAGLITRLSKMCDNIKYHYNEKIIAQKIGMLKELGLYDKALIETSKSEYIDMAYIQSERIKLLIELKEYYKALDITNRSIFKDNPIIKSQKVSVLILLGKIEDAKEVYEDAKKRMDISISKEALEKLRTRNSNKDDKDIKIELLTRLYADKIDLDIINESNIGLFEKVVLITGYYDKYNKRQAAYYLKDARKSFKDKKLKMLNQLLQEVSSKKNTIFNIARYEKILNANVKLSMIDNLEYQAKELKKEEIVKPSKKELPKVEIIETPKKIKETKYIVSIGSKVGSKNNNVNNTIINTIKDDKTTILVKDVLTDEVDEVEKYIYGLLAYIDTTYVTKVMKAFDIFENMSLKPATKENINKMLKLFESSTFKRRFNFNVSDAKIRKFVK